MAGSTDHRGRVQAQGGGTEKSVPWAQSTPPTASDGQRMLDELAAQLTDAELQARQDAFAQAREFIERSAQAGGVGPVKKSFPRKPVRGGIRVDIEVQKGLALIPDA
jgi:hypothetical protein